MRQITHVGFCILTILLLTLCATLTAQTTQTIKGQILDAQSEIPIIGATVEILTVRDNLGTVTDEDGYYRLTDIPVGRHELRISYLGYGDLMLPNVVVTAGKETILDVQLQEAFTAIDEVVVTADAENDRANNEMAVISARTFSVEEVTRYSGGRNDVSRLATNFAGVSSANDSRNDIVIRGNSPTGVLWRLEGIPIPNPNHFSTLGTTGGPVSALNTNLLRNSDFLTGAFPAEYGDALAGVFDIQFRKGNRDRHEFTAQLGTFSGLEAMAEGPINREKTGSYLVSYRHAFTAIGDALGIPVGTNAVPQYRDLSFKIALPKTKVGTFQVFGIGGLSEIDFLGDETDENDLFADPNVDAFPRSQLGVLGVKHNVLLNDKTYLRTTVAASYSGNTYDEFATLFGKSDKQLVVEVENANTTLSIQSILNHKVDAKTTIRTGILAQRQGLDLYLRDRTETPDLDGDGIRDWFEVQNFDGAIGLYQAFVQAQHQLTPTVQFNGGLHAQYLAFNERAVIEPRAAVSWDFLPRHTLTAAYGMHHQTQPLPILLQQERVTPGPSTGSGTYDYIESNKNLDFTRSQHYVLGWDYKPATDWRTRVELYYQDISQVAVQATPSSFSVLNVGADFVFPTDIAGLVNDGTGTNYGVELTVEKFFSGGYYGLLTGSLFESTYVGNDGVERNTAFNNQYVLNALAGKEWRIGRHAITADCRISTAGGRFFTPIDLAASQAAGLEVLQDDLAFSEQYDSYFRLDAKVGFQLNSKKRRFSQQFYLDFQNLTNRQNIFLQRYNDLTGEVNPVFQAGFFPDFMYRVQF